MNTIARILHGFLLDGLEGYGLEEYINIMLRFLFLSVQCEPKHRVVEKLDISFCRFQKKNNFKTF
jgi:hypothetical protein